MDVEPRVPQVLPSAGARAVLGSGSRLRFQEQMRLSLVWFGQMFHVKRSASSIPFMLVSRHQCSWGCLQAPELGGCPLFVLFHVIRALGSPRLCLGLPRGRWMLAPWGLCPPTGSWCPAIARSYRRLHAGSPRKLQREGSLAADASRLAEHRCGRALERACPPASSKPFVAWQGGAPYRCWKAGRRTTAWLLGDGTGDARRG